MDQGFERRRAAFALNRVEQTRDGSPPAARKGYKDLTRQLGPAMLINGASQAYAFEMVRARQGTGPELEGRMHALDDIALWTLSHFLPRIVQHPVPAPSDDAAAELSRILVGAAVDPSEPGSALDDAAVLLAREEMLKLLEWLKLFAAAELSTGSMGTEGADAGG